MGFKGATVNDVGVVPKSPGQLRSGYHQIATRAGRATMSGFGERMQRAARERIETFRRDASAAPAFAVRVRPLRQARALAANANGALGVPDAVAFVVEPKTGLRLPGEFCVRGQTSDCAPLAGMGVRVKRIAGVGVKVYACGLYVHPKQAKQSLGDAHLGRGVADVAGDQKLFDALLHDSSVTKTVRLTFARDLDSAKIADALSERLRPALGKDSKSLRTFEAYFDGVKFLKGQSLTFSADGGKLTTSIRESRSGSSTTRRCASRSSTRTWGKTRWCRARRRAWGRRSPRTSSGRKEDARTRNTIMTRSQKATTPVKSVFPSFSRHFRTRATSAHLSLRRLTHSSPKLSFERSPRRQRVPTSPHASLSRR
jgi:hypothetical protein